MTPHHVDPAPRLPPVPPYGVSQDVRYQYNYPENARGDARRGTFQQKLQDYQVTPPFHQQMVTGSLERAQSEFRDLEQKVRTNSIMIESLKDAIQEINHNIVNMEEAFTESLAASNRNIRSLGKRMMNLEEALEGLSMQITEMRCMLENIMQANSEDPISPEIIQVTPRSRPGSGTGYIPEESPPTPVGIMRPSGTTPFPLDTAMSLPGSSLRQLRYEDNLQSTAQVDADIVDMNRSLPPQSTSHGRQRMSDNQELGQSSFSNNQGPKVPKFDGKSPLVP